MKKQIAIVYIVAGMSSRFGGKIKQFARIGPKNETLIEYSLNQALIAGFDKIVFVVGNLTEKPFKEKFGNNYKGIPILYANQTFDENIRDKPWGTADAIASVSGIIDCNFITCNGDDIYGEEPYKLLYEHLQKRDDCAVVGYKLLNTLQGEGLENRGIFAVDDNNYIKSITETFKIDKNNLSNSNLDKEDLVSMNIYALTPTALSLLKEKVDIFKEKNKSDRKIECLLPQEITNLINENKLKIKIYPTDSKTYGVTSPDDEIKIKNKLIHLT